ncbi:hypothetical protein H4R26_003702 [Coemansia thaxteri]|uniref:Bifunctional polynucleotide phosphatase/kinase n=1 Tax=Coemansia thaxteri TaxID=2663907 RepID=A0A9W8BII8_9FUNG|nr:hypothetical protein H4R26_003702 [Coemansia thaxteri]KAJ2484490.1 hypothetical protein EV174_002396 [Coemansia sp. RSA 2320]
MMTQAGKRPKSNSVSSGTGSAECTQQKTIDSFFKPKKQRASETGEGAQGSTPTQPTIQWHEIGKTWLGRFGSPAPAAKFAAFDLDHTLICVKGKGRFPRNSDDWRFFHADVPKLLRNIHSQGYKIVIMSNQYGLKPNKGTTGLSTQAKDYRLKIAKIAQELQVPFTIYAAIDKDYMRKPAPGMWFMAELDNAGVTVDRASSFYVGDAAGRPAGWQRGVAADFSDSDLAFALNAGVPFYTPEEIITSEICARDEPMPPPVPRTWPLARFSPKSLAFDHDGHAALLADLEASASSAKAQNKGLLVLLVGPPACGKSTFASAHLASLGFERVNMDTLGTSKKCVDAVKGALMAGRCVVVDNTNPDPASRCSFISIASAFGASAVAVVFAHESRDLAMHNNQYRSKLVQARFFHRAAVPQVGQAAVSVYDVPCGSDRVPDVAYHAYFKRFVMPTLSEDLARVLHYPFVPSFDNSGDEALWQQYH